MRKNLSFMCLLLSLTVAGVTSSTESSSKWLLTEAEITESRGGHIRNEISEYSSSNEARFHKRMMMIQVLLGLTLTTNPIYYR